MRVDEISTDAAPDCNRAAFSEAWWLWWLTLTELLTRIEGGETAKGDLTELVRRCYL
ncbi:hypothetical protein [Deinococcus humi]|uniref:Uncharacterized protein n=1 Tax=Deinococcus humi TaxID=662880 RepID=A0A7W8JUF5_9DEIO|nr:hypothetical protein [Deinococcus humi]MBB5363364.1 hypothetical protein [Deinococcus humi]GGO26888.1 hypothetical protein GCM10008949_18050 [Deinococcus humi]